MKTLKVLRYLAISLIYVDLYLGCCKQIVGQPFATLELNDVDYLRILRRWYV